MTYSVSFAAANSLPSNITMLSVEFLTTDKIVIAYKTTSPTTECYVRIGTISGGTITLGSASVITENPSTYVLTALSSGSFVLAWESGGAVQCKVGTVSGTSITLGLTYASSYITSATYLSVARTSSGFIISGRGDSNTNIAAQAASVSGTVVTFGTGALVVTGSLGWFTSKQISASLVAFAYDQSGTKVKIVSISGTTITAGTEISDSDLTGTRYSIASKQDGAFIVTSSVSVANCRAKTFTHSGTTITAGTLTTIKSTTVQSTSSCTLGSNIYVSAYTNPSNSYAGTVSVGAYTSNIVGTTNDATFSTLNSTTNPKIISISSTNVLLSYLTVDGNSTGKLVIGTISEEAQGANSILLSNNF